jgi:hypothetical protein
MDPNIKQSIIDRLKQTNNVLVTVKNNPTVDQLAACIGLTLFLNKQGKHATAVFSGEVPSTIEFLKPEETLEKDTNSLRDFIIALDKSKADKLRYKVEDKVVKIFITPYRTSLSQDDLEFSQGDFNVDVVMALGVHAREELDQAIVAHGRILHDATVISINSGKVADLGALNWSDDKASSLSEMVAGLVEGMQANSLDSQMATAFLTGIVAETERFSNTKTTSTTMSISAKLMAAGANQQLVASKLQEAAPSKPTETVKKEDDGTLEIEHIEENTRDLPKPADDDSTIMIDEEGNLKTGLQDGDSKDKANDAGEPKKPTRLTIQPPTLGGRLTANAEPEREDEPSVDPLSNITEKPILEHKKLGTDKPNNAPDARPSITKENIKTLEIKPTETLSAIEQQVDSPHTTANQAAQTASSLNDLFAQPTNNDNLAPPASVPSQAAPSVPSPLPTSQIPSVPPVSASPATHLNDVLSQNSSNDDVVEDVPATASSVSLPATPGIDDARKAVEAAAQASINSAPEPIHALNAQTLGDNFHAPTQTTPADNVVDTATSQPVSPQPADLGLNLPPNLIPPDPGLPPEQTGINQPPTSPPPVPPPLMPPGM